MLQTSMTDDKVQLCFSYTIKQQGEEKNRILRFIGSDESQDRGGDRILNEGWELDNFVKNPVFLWAHDYFSLPIGKAQGVTSEKGKLIFDIQFATADQYEFADTVYKLYKGGFLTAVSVGFIPKEWKFLEKEDDDPSQFFMPKIFLRQELLELSAVPVPANANALMQAVTLGAVSADEAQSISNYVLTLAGLWTPLNMASSYNNSSYMDTSERRSAVPYKKTPLAPEDTEWSQGDEVAKSDTDALEIMAVYVETRPKKKPGMKKAYRGIHHDGSDEHLTVWKAVRAVAADIESGKYDDISDADRVEVKSHISKHYKDFDKGLPPWERDSHELSFTESLAATMESVVELLTLTPVEELIRYLPKSIMNKILQARTFAAAQEVREAQDDEQVAIDEFFAALNEANFAQTMGKLEQEEDGNGADDQAEIDQFFGDLEAESEEEGAAV
jgi:HK97 family phage prohead protease